MPHDSPLTSFCHPKSNSGSVTYWNFSLWGERNSSNKLINEKVVHYLKLGELGLVFILNFGLKNWITNKIIFTWNTPCNGKIGNHGDINTHAPKLLDQKTNLFPKECNKCQKVKSWRKSILHMLSPDSSRTMHSFKMDTHTVQNEQPWHVSETHIHTT